MGERAGNIIKDVSSFSRSVTPIDEPGVARKTLSIKTEEISPRVIRFVASDESLDRDGDTISADGWDLAAYLENPVVLYGHNQRGFPFGKSIAVFVDKRKRQLINDVWFPEIKDLCSDPTHPTQHALDIDMVYNMARLKLLNTESVAFRGTDYTATATGRAYKRQELMEISIVPVPANPNAVAILRAAGATDTVIKGVTMPTIETKGNKRLSKESQSYLAERVAALDKACQELKAFIADDPDPAAEGEPDDKTGNPVVNEEIGSDANTQQPEKQYVIEIVEKASTTSDK